MSPAEQDRRNKKLPFEEEALIIKGEIEDLKTKQAEQEKRDEEYKRSQFRFNRLVTWFTGGLLITSVIAGCISIYMAYVTKQSADAANVAAQAASAQVEAAKAAQRAFVTFSGITVKHFGLKKGQVTGVAVDIQWRNTGGSAARTVFSRINASERADELPEGFNYPDLGTFGDQGSQAVVGTSQVITSSLKLPISQLTALREKRSRIFCWGWLTYKDIFRDSPLRLSEFSIELFVNVAKGDIPISSPENTIHIDYLAWRDHNCTDEDCKDYEKRVEFSDHLLKNSKSK